jgi:hypothetical protein
MSYLQMLCGWLMNSKAFTNEGQYTLKNIYILTDWLMGGPHWPLHTSHLQSIVYPPSGLAH